MALGVIKKELKSLGEAKKWLFLFAVNWLGLERFAVIRLSFYLSELISS
jgi:hypothetical protein